MKFDLTTVEGKKSAKKLAKNMGLGLHVFIIEKVFDLFSNDDTIKEQRQTAVDIIKAGKENNADEIEVTLDQNAGIDIQSEIEGIPAKIKIGKNGNMKIKVKYK